ncbi:MAG TPA: hypothetical protein EYG51_16785 [Pseudomonadales bacterium]|nr:hypothetical protein [Pseudomonadales bacterium]
MNDNLKPELITLMSDDELNRRLDGLKRKIDRTRYRGGDDNLRLHEVDYCYLYRELEVRRARDGAHAEYLKTRDIRRVRKPEMVNRFQRKSVDNP